MVSICAVLIVRNESRIIERCLRSLSGVCDGFCICDTGSEDDTIEVAERVSSELNKPWCIFRHEWKDFGHNRSASFQEALRFAESNRWDPAATFALVVDADMVLACPSRSALVEVLRGQGAGLVLQKNSGLEYFNLRFLRMDLRWRCVGSTHEYWAADGESRDWCSVDRTVCSIQDENDGGCKSDKFKRDLTLLMNDLRSGDNTDRTLFYLGQTHQHMDNFEHAISFYRKRIAAGGWDQEVWYSHLSIARCFARLSKDVDAEYWYLKAISFDNSRAEPYFELATMFDAKMQHHKAWHYCTEGLKIPKPQEGLFVEAAVYDVLLKHQSTLLAFYVGQNSYGLDASLDLLDSLEQTQAGYLENVLHNLRYYVMPLPSSHKQRWDLPSLTHPADGQVCTPSSVSVLRVPGLEGVMLANVRHVSYRLMDDSTYTNTSPLFRTMNRIVVLNASTGCPLLSELANGVWREVCAPADLGLVCDPRATILGLEDVRLEGVRVTADGQEVTFSATQLEFRGTAADDLQNRMVRGTLDLATHVVKELSVLPARSTCEKNWIFVRDTPAPTYIYTWHPFELVRVTGRDMQVVATFPTPAWWKNVRGSSNICRHLGTGAAYAVVHFKIVGNSGRMEYFHMLVKLDLDTTAPVAYSRPFVFDKVGVEYCLGLDVSEHDDAVSMFYSSNDSNPACTHTTLRNFHFRPLSRTTRS
jgi:glycosyltransferase involved in cell wall biosynthesis